MLPKAVVILKNLGFKGGTVDLYLFTQESEDGINYIALYVHNNLMIGDHVVIDWIIFKLKASSLILSMEDN